MIYATNYYERRIIRIKKPIAGEHQIGAFNTPKAFGGPANRMRVRETSKQSSGKRPVGDICRCMFRIAQGFYSRLAQLSNVLWRQLCGHKRAAQDVNDAVVFVRATL